jgi:hypothetical protein
MAKAERRVENALAFLKATQTTWFSWLRGHDHLRYPMDRSAPKTARRHTISRFRYASSCQSRLDPLRSMESCAGQGVTCFSVFRRSSA